MLSLSTLLGRRVFVIARSSCLFYIMVPNKSKLIQLNRQVFGIDNNLSLKDIRLRYHQSEIERFMKFESLEQDKRA